MSTNRTPASRQAQSVRQARPATSARSTVRKTVRKAVRTVAAQPAQTESVTSAAIALSNALGHQVGLLAGVASQRINGARALLVSRADEAKRVFRRSVAKVEARVKRAVGSVDVNLLRSAVPAAKSTRTTQSITKSAKSAKTAVKKGVKTVRAAASA